MNGFSHRSEGVEERTLFIEERFFPKEERRRLSAVRPSAVFRVSRNSYVFINKEPF